METQTKDITHPRRNVTCTHKNKL